MENMENKMQTTELSPREEYQQEFLPQVHKIGATTMAIALILSLLIHIIGGKVLPILFMMFYSFGAIFLLLSAAGTYFEIGCSKYLPYYLSGALPLTAESGPYLQLFGIIGLLTILAFCADLLVLRKKDL